MMSYILSFIKPRQLLNPIDQKTAICVQDISFVTIDEETKTITGSLDLGTAPFNGSYGNECGFRSKYICQYENFYILDNSYSDDKQETKYDVVRVLPSVNPDRPAGYGPWMETPNKYEKPEQLKVFEDFCKKCNVNVEYPPSLKQ